MSGSATCAPPLLGQVPAKPLLRRWAQPRTTPGEGQLPAVSDSVPALGEPREERGCLLKTMD